MALEPGPMQVIKNFHSTKDEVLDDIKKLDLWPTVYVSERMEELPFGQTIPIAPRRKPAVR